MRPLRVLMCCLAALAILPAAGAWAKATDAQIRKVHEDYISDGALDPCKHTSEALRAAKNLITPDIEQYAPDLDDGIDTALEARARGECKKKTDDSSSGSDRSSEPSSGGSSSDGSSGGSTTPTSTPTPSADASATPSATATATTSTTPSPTPTQTVVAEPPAPPVPSATPVVVDDGRVARVALAEPANAAPAPIVWIAILAAMMITAVSVFLVSRFFGVGEERVAATKHAWQEASWRASGAWQDFLDWLRIGR